MKAHRISRAFPLLPLLAGAVAFGLREWLFRGGMDEKGLIVSAHPARLLSWALTAVVCAVIFVLAQRQTLVCPPPGSILPASVPAGVGRIAAAMGILFSAVQSLRAGAEPFVCAAAVAGVLAAVCLLLMTFSRCSAGWQSAFSAVLTLYFLLRLLSQYRMWSWTTQLEVYAFPLLATVMLLLAAYNRAALLSGLERRRSFVFFAQAALYFSIPAMDSQSVVFYGAMAVWMALDGLPAAPEGKWAAQ